MDGIFNIYKEKEYTSFDCVAIVRRASGEKKVGHTGTLDPNATGVLTCCLGKATRIIEYLEDDTKEYIGRLKLGIDTNTYDIWGEVVENDEENARKLIESHDNATEFKRYMEEIFARFKGDIEQLPPAYSAIKHKGKKLYEYARKGEDVELKPRKVHIASIDVLNVDIENATVDFSMICSKGTYVRSLCHDVGKVLGCGGTMAALERSRNGLLHAKDGISIEDVKQMSAQDIKSKLIPMEEMLGFMESLDVRPIEANMIKQGKRLGGAKASDDVKAAIKKGEETSLTGNFDRKYYRIFTENKFVGVAYYSPKHKMIVADKVLNHENI